MDLLNQSIGLGDARRPRCPLAPARTPAVDPPPLVNLPPRDVQARPVACIVKREGGRFTVDPPWERKQVDPRAGLRKLEDYNVVAFDRAGREASRYSAALLRLLVKKSCDLGVRAPLPCGCVVIPSALTSRSAKSGEPVSLLSARASPRTATDAAVGVDAAIRKYANTGPGKDSGHWKNCVFYNNASLFHRAITALMRELEVKNH
jgi:hypothetical protein